LNDYLEAMQLLGDYQAKQGNHAQAIHYYTQVVRKDRYLEAAHRGLMNSQAALGQRNEALKTYRRLVRIMRQEFGADPSPESARLYEKILQTPL
jgi:DNA-binding SARP family transcriptional activator